MRAVCCSLFQSVIKVVFHNDINKHEGRQTWFHNIGFAIVFDRFINIIIERIKNQKKGQKDSNLVSGVLAIYIYIYNIGRLQNLLPTPFFQRELPTQL